MALGLTQPLTEMSTRNLPGGKERQAHEAISPPSVSRLCRKCGSFDVSEPYGPSWPVTRIALPLPRWKIIVKMYLGAIECTGVRLDSPDTELRYLGFFHEHGNAIWIP
jgi:hypothetical protein